MTQVVTSLPVLEVTAGGDELPDGVMRTLTGVRVQRRLSLPTQCELTFVDPEDLARLDSLLPGAALSVRVVGASPDLFVGEVTATEYEYQTSGGLVVRVRGYDRLHRLRKRQEIRSFEGLDVEDLAKELAGAVDLEVEVDQAGPEWEYLIQHGQTDLDFLNEVAARAGLYLTLEGDQLTLATLEGQGDPVPLTMGRTLHEGRFELNADRVVDEVRADGWNPRVGDHHTADVDGPRLGREVRASVRAQDVGGASERFLTGRVSLERAHSEAAAQAELDRSAASEVVLRGSAQGDPRLRPGGLVEVDGVARPLAGRYVLTAVDHVIDAEAGFVSEISTAPPAPKQTAAPHGATLGYVVDVDDPDERGRVRVSLPAFHEVETHWMQVCLPGAGEDKGLVAVPSVDDRVLVLPVEGDPTHAVVLGGLYAHKHDPPEADDLVTGGDVERFMLRGRKGNVLLLDDDAGRVLLENEDGSYLELADNKVRLCSERNLLISAPGKRITIEARRIDFKKA